MLAFFMNELTWQVGERRRPGNSIVPATDRPRIIDQKVYVPRLLGNLGHRSIQGLFVSHVRDDRDYVAVDLQEFASNSYFFITSRALK